MDSIDAGRERQKEMTALAAASDFYDAVLSRLSFEIERPRVTEAGHSGLHDRMKN